MNDVDQIAKQFPLVTAAKGALVAATTFLTVLDTIFFAAHNYTILSPDAITTVLVYICLA